MKLTQEDMHELEILAHLEEKDFDHNTCDNSFIDLVMNAGKKAFKIIKKQQKEIERQASLIKFDVKYRNQLEQDLYENASNYVVPKKTIRKKIKWIEDNILENEYASSKDKDIAEYQVDILKELLGE